MTMIIAYTAKFGLVVAVFFWNLGQTSGCGVLVHIEILKRTLAKLAFEDFSCKPGQEDCVNKDGNNLELRQLHEIFTSHLASFNAGAPYPDAFYNFCVYDKYKDISEDTHWAGFMNASINYIRKQPKPWNEATWKLVAFIYGVSSHQISDILWHNLGGYQNKLKYGFLQASANADFEGSFAKAHPRGDFGADIYGAMLWDTLPQMKEVGWEVPVQQLHEIYTEYYGSDRIPASVVENCTVHLFMFQILEFLISANHFGNVLEETVFLLQQLEDYYKGGMDDMVAWSIKLYGLVTQLLNNGTGICEFSAQDKNYLDLRCNSVEKVHFRSSMGGSLGLLEDLDIDINKILPAVTEYLAQNNGYVINRSSRYFNGKQFLYIFSNASERKFDAQNERDIRDLLQSFRSLKGKKVKTQSHPPPTPGQSSFITCSSPYSNFGWALTQIKINDKEYLVIGAPGWSSGSSLASGKVFGVEGSRLHENLHFGYSVANKVGTFEISVPGENFVKFGHSLAAADMDGDGQDELLIGAPSSGGRTSNSVNYLGAIVMYKRQGNAWSLSPTVWNGTSFDENLGFVMQTVRIQGQPNYLLTSSPFVNSHRGALYKISLNGGKQMLAMGTLEGEWFGHSLTVEPGPNPRYAYVGAPYKKHCAGRKEDECRLIVKKGSGAVYRVDLQSGDCSVLIQNSLPIPTDSFGWAVKSLNASLLLVSNPTSKGNGAYGSVDLFHISTDRKRASFLWKYAERRHVYDGNQDPFINFGSSLEGSVDEQFIAVGSPFWRDYTEERRQAAGYGKLYVLHFAPPNRSPEAFVTPEVKFEAEGAINSSRLGHSLFLFRGNGPSQLVVSSPGYSQPGVTMSGAVTIWSSSSLTTTTTTTTTTRSQYWYYTKPQHAQDALATCSQMSSFLAMTTLFIKIANHFSDEI